jgi:hypothetical protein
MAAVFLLNVTYLCIRFYCLRYFNSKKYKQHCVLKGLLIITIRRGGGMFAILNLHLQLVQHWFQMFPISSQCWIPIDWSGTTGEKTRITGSVQLDKTLQEVMHLTRMLWMPISTITAWPTWKKWKLQPWNLGHLVLHKIMPSPGQVGQMYMEVGLMQLNCCI